jgi:putative ABC transport system ATP-binding protein
MKPFIELRSVTKSYARGREKVEVLRNVDLAIERGEYVSLMGPSGSGKTTLLNLIGGLDRPSGGSVCVEGQQIDLLSAPDLAAWRATNVGFVFQSYHLMSMLSARHNVELPLLLTRLGTNERRRRADIALELVGLTDRASHRPSELSGGQQQRVAIARAIVTDPALLVCDEPTGDLDRPSADAILELLDMLHRDLRKTVLMVTHDPQAAVRAGRTIHLDKGVLSTPPAVSSSPP